MFSDKKRKRNGLEVKQERKHWKLEDQFGESNIQLIGVPEIERGENEIDKELM